MAKYKQKDGRLQDEKGNWVWNGESYEFVQSHTDWLPLAFQSQSDAAKFEKLEKIWKAEQILKNPASSVVERKTAQKILNSLGATVKHSDMNDAISYTYLYHSGKGKERAGHKYSFREWAGDGWRYFYDNIGIEAKKDRDLARNISERDYEIAREAEQDVNEYLFKESRNYRRLQSNAKEAAKQSLDSFYKYKQSQIKYDKTLLGKVEKGLELINNLFKKKK